MWFSMASPMAIHLSIPRCQVSYRQFMDVLVPLLSSAELQPQVLAMLNSLGSSGAGKAWVTTKKM